MNRPDLDSIEARAKAATKGPWEYKHDRSNRDYDTVVNKHDEICASTICGHEAQANAKFIAASRSDIPDLLAYVRHLEALVGTNPSDSQLGYRECLAHYMEGVTKPNVPQLLWSAIEQRYRDERLAAADAYYRGWLENELKQRKARGEKW